MQEISYGHNVLHSTSHSLTTDFPSDNNQGVANNVQWSVNKSERQSTEGTDFESAEQTTDDKALMQRVSELPPRDDENDSGSKDRTNNYSTGSKSSVADFTSNSQSVTVKTASEDRDTTLKDQTKESTESLVIDTVPDKKETDSNINLPGKILIIL